MQSLEGVSSASQLRALAASASRALQTRASQHKPTDRGACCRWWTSGAARWSSTRAAPPARCAACGCRSPRRRERSRTRSRWGAPPGGGCAKEQDANGHQHPWMEGRARGSVCCVVPANGFPYFLSAVKGKSTKYHCWKRGSLVAFDKSSTSRGAYTGHAIMSCQRTAGPHGNVWVLV